ncbi:MAG TPA: hypothetical protein VIG30_02340 [Ktedonobacterales bacterium]
MIQGPRQVPAIQPVDEPLATPGAPAAGAPDAPAPLAASPMVPAILALLASRGLRIVPPGPRDLVVLLRGMPVAPWVPLRAASDVWAAWLAQLERLWTQWIADPLQAIPAPDAANWDAWRGDHIISLETRRVGPAIRLLVDLLGSSPSTRETVHLVGHSVGGAAILTYLAQVRANRLPLPAPRLRTAITLDAAVSGVAGVWSGARRALGTTVGRGMDGLGVWAARRGLALVTATNRHDIWSHRALGDLAYLPFRLGPPRGALRQLDGTIHGWLRRTPHLVEALWGAEPAQWSDDCAKPHTFATSANCD